VTTEEKGGVGGPTITTVSELEAKLAEKVTLETDIRDLFLIEGIGLPFRIHQGPIYRACNEEMRSYLRERYMESRSRRTRVEKGRKARLFHCLMDFYYNRESAPIGELKTIIEEKGPVYRDMGYITIATLNDVLAKHGLEPFKVGDRKYRRAGEEILARYGLEKAKTYRD
jgi:hypothetical protein